MSPSPPFQDYVGVISDASKLVTGGSTSVTTLTSNVVWPNEFEPVEDGTLPSPYNVSGIICGGFIPPTKSTGAIQLLDLTKADSSPTTISVKESGFFYHKTYFMDIDGDGLKDVLAARTNFPTSGTPTGQLVYLPQPNPFAAPWEEIVLVEGPDVFFVMYDVDGDGMDEVLAAQFFEYPGLWMYWCDSSTWSVTATNLFARSFIFYKLRVVFSPAPPVTVIFSFALTTVNPHHLPCMSIFTFVS